MNWKINKKQRIFTGRETFICLLIMLFVNSGLAQTEYSSYSSYKFSSLTMEDGLPNNRVNSICKDNEGFMWFGTNEGIARFDGYNLKIFKHNPDDSTTICNNLIRDIFLDSRNRLWIGTDEGIDLFDQEKELFRHVSTKENGRIKNITWEFAEIGKDTVIATTAAGLYQLNDHATAQYVSKRYLFPDSLEATSIFRDSKKNIYIGTKTQGLFLYNKAAGKIRQYMNLESDKNSISGNRIECITEDKKGKIWIGTYDNGLNCFYPEKEYFDWIDFDGEQNYNYRVRSVVFDNYNRMWVGTYKGLYLKGIGDDSFVLYAHKNSGLSRITNISIYDIYIDNQEIMWLGTYSGGANYCDFNQKKFNQYTYRENDPRFLNDEHVLAICSDNQNNLWIGTEKGGLSCFNSKTKRFEFFVSETKKKQVAIGNSIRCIFDDNENIWAGVFQDGLRCYNKSTRKSVNYNHNPNDPNSIISNTVYSITTDNNKNLWIGTRDGLDLFDPKSKHFIHFNQKPGEKYGFGNDRIYVVYKDSENNIWLGSTKKGIFLLNRKDSTFISISKKLENYAIVAIQRDNKGQIWAGGNEGLIFYNINNDSLIHYTEKDGLPTNKISAILTDENGNLWISTSNGLVKFNNAVNTPYKPNFKVFKTSQGLNILQFASNSFFKSASGELFFGGMNGFISFYPDQIKDNEFLPSVKITGLTILNKEVKIGQKIGNHIILEKSITTEDRIKLSYKHYAFTFEFSAMHYSQSKENHYAYMLEGFDKDWIYPPQGVRYATYSNLPGKEYIFKVKACNNDGVWNENPSELRIRVLPPFWKTWWFITIMVFLVICFIVILIKYREYNINLQKRILQKRVDQRTAELSEANTLLEERQEEIIIQNEELERHRNNLEELVAERTSELELARKKAEEADRLKSAFLANMSHEIRTPMNAIVGISNLLVLESDPKEKEEYVKIISNNCENLMVIINDILDISLIEANQLKIDLSPFNAIEILNELENLYKYKQKPNVTIVFDPPENSKLILKADQYRFRQVINNLLSNALKYTEYGEIRIGYTRESDRIVFYVKDTGIGIEREDFEKIFEYFHKLENSTTRLYKGTGIGLTISKKLVTMLGGEIWLESVPGSGSTFYFSLPYKENLELNPITKKDYASKIAIPDLHIIIAEDEEVNFFLFQKMLKPLQAEITWLKNGKEVAEYLKNKTKLGRSIVIMDIKMPEMNGIEAFYEIRKTHKNLPIIAVTAYASENERKEILHHGFTDYLSKPVDFEKLIEKIREATTNF